MSTTRFNWDKYFADAKWNDIYKNSPFFNYQRLPSLIHEKEGLIYLSSVDLAFSISHANNLNDIMPDIKLVFKNALQSKDYYKAAIASSDFYAIKNILSSQGMNNCDSLEDY
ncbi:MAG: hypothetical protein COA61_006405 [Zetaproteobacteria bacterium]|nr:hypothetical protein [Zetaproteobacteria bacterium]